jgi:uncharacterized membrane protein
LTSGHRLWSPKKTEDLKMNMRIVLAVWCVIVGGIMFIIEDGKIIKICIACNSTLFLALAVISILLGVVGIVGGLKGSAVSR